MTDTLYDQNGILIQGYVKIYDPSNNDIFVDKHNAIHYENMSYALAESLSNAGQGWVHEINFGNGGTSPQSEFDVKHARRSYAETVPDHVRCRKKY